MARIKYILPITLSVFLSCALIGQEDKWYELRDQGANFYEIQDAFNEEWEGREYERGNGYNLFKRWEHFIAPRVYPSGDINISREYIKAFDKVKNSLRKGTNKSNGNWQPIGYEEWDNDSYNPGNGRVNLIVKDPNIDGRYYVGTPSGGLWRTNDSFGSWTPITDDLPTLGVSGICIHPDNSDVIYIATGDGDGGDTYSNGVLKSEDGGASWQTTGLSYLLETEVRIHKLLMHPLNPDVIFAATRNGLWKTTNGGLVWYEVQTGNIRDIEFKPGDAQTMYCVSNRIYKSTDGGEDFSTSGDGMPSPGFVERISLGVSLDEPDYVYALCVDDNTNGFLGLYRSEDSGENFQLKSDSPNVLGYPSDGSGEGGQGSYDLALDVNPENGENIFVGGINVWRSINGGEGFIVNSHWFYQPGMTLNYVHADIHNIQYIDGDLFVCSDGGVFRSTNNGVSFEDVSEGLQISQFYRFGGYPNDLDLLIGGTQDNGSVMKNGQDWTHVLGGDGMEAAIHPMNPDYMYCASQFGNIRRSENGGQSWSGAVSDISDNGAWVTPYVLDPNDVGVIYAGFTEIHKSTNNGNSWTQLTDLAGDIPFNDMSICRSNSNVVYACTNGVVHKTVNGEDWFNVDSGISPFAISYIDVNPEDENDVAIALSGFGDGEKVYRSSDGGENWENISFNLPNIPANCVSIDSDDGGIYVGTDLGVFYQSPDLVNWIPFNDGLPNVIVNEMEINNLEDVITASSYGRGVWRSAQFQGIDESPVASFSSSDQIICAGDSITFFDQSYGHEPGWTWEFEGSVEGTSNDQNPLIHYNEPGFYMVSLTVENAEGESTSVEDFYIAVQAAEETFPYSESFEGEDDLESFDFFSVPFSGDVNWKLSDSVGHTGDQCLWIDNGFLDEPFEAELFSKQFNLEGLDTVWLSFWYSYAQIHEVNDDRLRFYTSNNCGQTYLLKEQFRGTQSLNTVGTEVIGSFTPNDWDWTLFTYPLSMADMSESFSFKLRFSNDNGNHIYIDDINLGDIDLSTSELSYDPSKLSDYPNPADETLFIQVSGMDSRGELVIENSLGQTVDRLSSVKDQDSLIKTDVSSFVPGIYFVRILSESGVSLGSKKILVH